MLINEVARLAGMSKDGIRHYEEMGLITSSAKQAGSRTYRDYDGSVLGIIEQVRQAQRLGFSLAEIGPLLEAYRSAEPTPEQTVGFLEERLTVIRAKQAELREVEMFIETKIARYREMLAHHSADSVRTLRERAAGPAPASTRTEVAGGAASSFGDSVNVQKTVRPALRNSLRPQGLHPFAIDPAIDDDVRDVQPGRPELARHTLRDHAQSGLRRGEVRETRPTAKTGGRAGEENRAAAAR